MMFDYVSQCMYNGAGFEPWSKQGTVKFLCPVPGYDRHFAITQHFGIEMINIPLYEDGPDMDMVEEYVNNDPTVKGIWCVPKYSNPTGISYSDETVKRFAALKPAAEDFRIYWDNAYCIHEFEGEYVPFPNLIALCEEAGKPDMANELYEYICEECKKTVPVVEKGVFGAHMHVSLLNDGPFTIVLDSEKL